ncbi:MAG TPA: heme ABC exporter ATP-binding protein CcmA [Gemmatimonadaceae bacterium]
MNQAPAVRASALAKSFGARMAVRDVELTLAAGDCLAIFGPNGAGKTTLLRLIAGLLKPTGGAVKVRDVDMRHDAPARAAVGLVSHHTMLYAPLTALENVEFAARLFGVPNPAAASLAALTDLGMAGAAGVRVSKLSRGQQQRVSLARAIVHSPTVLLLDEPYSGLDESGASALTALLHTLRAGGATLILVTHNIGEGLALATHAAVMLEGRLARIDAQPSGGFDAAGYVTKYRELVGINRD